MKRSLALCLALACALAPGRSAAQDAKKADKGEGVKLAAKTQALFKQYCHRCHGRTFLYPGLNVLDFKGLKADPGDGEKPYIIPNKPGASKLYRRLTATGKRSMPPPEVPERPSAADQEVVKKWIEAGAPEPPPPPKEDVRRFISTKEMLRGMHDYLRNLDEPMDRPYIRFFTLTNMNNDPRILTRDLRGYRAALSKALNSLSWKRAIVLPRAVDKEQTIYALDIRDLDWDRNHLWRAIMRTYPYGLSYADSEDTNLRRLDKDLSTMTGCEIPYVRADWFVATATRPPLYHILVKIPTNAKVLEAKLDVDIPANFRRNRLWRAGFTKSGVSAQNRLVERHEARYGAYWKSYDFKAKGDRDNLIDFPLGPVFRGNPYFNPDNPKRSPVFAHDGGEIIFNLPNGLQAYMLIDAKDKRIDFGPTEVVRDLKETSGSVAIFNGVSCMACHKHGMIPLPKEEIRDGNSLGGDARLKVRRLYPEEKVMKRMIARDEEQFVRALERATIPLLLDKDEATKPRSVADLKVMFEEEAVGALAGRYRLTDLHLDDVAYELGINKPELLGERLKGRRFRALGLGALIRGGGLKRDVWERVGATSMFQRIARELEMGTPVNIVK
jgi:serine/threonine-protein kinase